MTSAHPVSGPQRLVWGPAALTGVAAAVAASGLAGQARAYCDAAREPPRRCAHVVEFGLLLLVCPLLALALARAARRATVRGPRSVRAAAQRAVVLLAVAVVTWWYVATRGTPDGYPGDSGLCPAGNVPPWWPGWPPA